MEAALLGLFMISACVFTVLLEHPGSPARGAIPDPFVRRLLIGLAMGATAIAADLLALGQAVGRALQPGDHAHLHPPRQGRARGTPSAYIGRAVRGRDRSAC